MAHALIATLFVAITGIIYFYGSYRKFCIEMCAKHKQKFFARAKQLFDSGSLNDAQKEKISKWGSTIDSRQYAVATFFALKIMYHQVKEGKNIRIDEAQLKDYSDEIADLFLLWIWSLIYTIPSLSLFSKDWAFYIFNPENHKDDTTRIIEVNKTVFKENSFRRKICHAA